MKNPAKHHISQGLSSSAPRRTRTFNQLIKSQLLYH
jgi:hypothetical protein